MWFFDTNILIYSIVALDETKMKQSQELIDTCIKNQSMLISPVTLQELVYALVKLKVDKQLLVDSLHSFFKYTKHEIDAAIVKEAFNLCNEADFCRNIRRNSPEVCGEALPEVVNL